MWRSGMLDSGSAGAGPPGDRPLTHPIRLLPSQITRRLNSIPFIHLVLGVFSAQSVLDSSVPGYNDHIL
jgi:hypothetical protein